MSSCERVLSDEQQAVVEAVVSGSNVLCMGPAGTGKSFIIDTVCDALRKQGKNVYVTATTGNAAVNLREAMTLHSFMGIGVPLEETLEEYWKMMIRSIRTLKRVGQAEVVIIDEVSFLSGRFFLLIDLLLRAARDKPDLPFGGIQLVLTGDFFQLPPVFKDRQCPWSNTFCFEMFSVLGLWVRRFDLTQVYRQKNQDFATALSTARLGKTSQFADMLFRRCLNTVFPDDGIAPTMLCCTNKDVDSCNLRLLTSVPDKGLTRLVAFGSRVRLLSMKKNTVKKPNGGIETTYIYYREPLANTERLNIVRKTLTGQARLPPEHRVRTGMVVMFRANLSVELKVANGTTGVVKGWVPADELSFLRCLAPITEQQFKVASVEKPPKGLRCRPRAMPDGKNKDGVCIAREDEPQATSKLLPVVQLVDGRLLVVSYHDFRFNYSKDLVVQYIRLPIVPGWAISVHKSQGMTLGRLLITLNDDQRWHPAQAYVAFSRCTGPDALKLSGTYKRSMFYVHKKVSLNFGTNGDCKEHRLGADWNGSKKVPEIAAVTFAKLLADVRTLKLYKLSSKTKDMITRPISQEYGKKRKY